MKIVSRKPDFTFGLNARIAICFETLRHRLVASPSKTFTPQVAATDALITPSDAIRILTKILYPVRACRRAAFTVRNFAALGYAVLIYDILLIAAAATDYFISRRLPDGFAISITELL
ncbi:MAG: hypothetical protein ABIP78_02560 [Pyrinomonadaceae bacterium]